MRQGFEHHWYPLTGDILQPLPAEQSTTLADVPLGPSVTVTVERRGDIVLVGLNRPFIQNRIDPASLRALVLFGHGENFSRGIDVDAAQAGLLSGQRPVSATPTLDVLGNSQPHRSTPVVVVGFRAILNGEARKRSCGDWNGIA